MNPIRHSSSRAHNPPTPTSASPANGTATSPHRDLTPAQEESVFKAENEKNWPDFLDSNNPDTNAASAAGYFFGVSPHAPAHHNARSRHKAL